VDAGDDDPLGLTINEAKTSVKDVSTQSFDFLGYTFGTLYNHRNGHSFLGASPSRKSLKRIKTKIGELLRPGEKASWPGVRKRLNRLLDGWSAYVSYGATRDARQAVDRHVSERVRRFLVKRMPAPGRGVKAFPCNVIFGKPGVRKLNALPRPRGAVSRS
jgi:RNA-directed DNA polymerase